MFTPPPCPSCGQILAPEPLRRRMSGKYLGAGPRPGVICDKCGAKLKLHPKRVYVLLPGIFGFVIVGAFLIGHFKPRALERSTVYAAYALLTLLAYRYGPFLARLTAADPSENLNFPSDPVDTAEMREAEARRQEETERIENINAPGRRDWICPKCAAENPSTFDMCWRCEAVREQRDI
jgi:ribosomal protein L40E